MKPDLKCGVVEPWSKHTPMEPNINDHKSMCKACRCQYTKVGDTYQTDCKPPFAEGIKSVGDWNNCPGGIRDCEALEGQCVSATFKMDSAPEVPEIGKVPSRPELKCGVMEPWSKHTPFEPNVN